MSKQLHKNFTGGQVKSLLKSYPDKEIKMNYILQMLKIKRKYILWIPSYMLRKSR